MSAIRRPGPHTIRQQVRDMNHMGLWLDMENAKNLPPMKYFLEQTPNETGSMHSCELWTTPERKTFLKRNGL